MAVELPLDENGKLVPFDSAAVTAMDIKRRGVRDDTHVEYNFGPDGSGCRRKFSCAWDERFNALIYFVGAAVSYLDPDDSDKRKISRLVPQRDPDYPNWICTKCELVGFRYMGELETPASGSEPLPVNDRCDLVCTYEMVPFEVRTDDATVDEKDRYVTKPGFPTADVTTEASYIGMPGSVMKYTLPTGDTGNPKGVPIPYPVGFTEPGRKLSVVWHRVPYDCWGPESAANAALYQRVIGTADTRGHLGAVNLTTFFGMWSTTLLLISVEEKLLPDPTGLGYSWNLKFVFMHKPVPYGHFGFYYHAVENSPPNPSGYYQALRGDAGTTTTIDDPSLIEDAWALFPVREMDELFVVGTV